MSYSTRTDIEDIFGIANVASWADLDSDEDATKITNRITRAIAHADAMINAILTDSQYTIPLSALPGKTLGLITTISATLSGCWLYEARGLNDADDEGRPFNRYSAKRKQAEVMLGNIAEGSLKIDAVEATKGVGIPFVV
ncbi:MAG: phage protein Gp36 family protein [Phycisphaeraceae bacterium JB051]